MLEFEPFKEHGESQPQEGRDPLVVSKLFHPSKPIKLPQLDTCV